MDVTCTCGTGFEARSAKARYCSDRCRKRKVKADVTELATAERVADALGFGHGPVEKATTDALTKAERVDTPLGQACLVLARRLDAPGLDTGSAMAAVARQLEATLTTAMRGADAASKTAQLQDELAARRSAHGA